jgi:peptidyl-prolyl cis-trans isomerase B (cyclophilin B)
MVHALLMVAALGAAAQDAAVGEKAAGGPVAVVETDLGSFAIRLLPELAPRHVEHFLATGEAGDYAGTTFHRIIPGGIIQGGDPLTRNPDARDRYGTGGLGLLPAELSDRPMTRGSVAAVLRPGQPDSGGSQFFICLFDQPALTGQYTIFGEVVEGMDVVDAIGRTPVEGDRAQERVEIRSLRRREPE